MNKKKYNTGIWTKQEIDYLKYNAGKYPISFIVKKLNRSKGAVWQRLIKLNIKVKDCMIGHDYLTEKEFANELGISVSRVQTLRKNKVIAYKDLGHYIGIQLTELDKMKEFFNDWIDPKTCYRILAMHKSTFKTKLIDEEYYRNLSRQKIGNCNYFKREEILEIKKKLQESYTIKQFAQETFYDTTTIENFIKKNKLDYFYLSGYRIPKTELNKFKN